MFSMVTRGLVVASLVATASCFVTPPARCYVNTNTGLAPGAVCTPVLSGSSSRNNLSTSGVRVQHPSTTFARRGNCALRMSVELGPEETVEKYGLEAGLFKALKSGGDGKDGKGGGATAQDLLKRYGSAYLITSISFAIVSFGICYVAVSNGVDMAALLSKVGIQAGAAGEQTGTVAIAYAIHKAASPIRFPPTVALTPVVAKLLGKEEEASEEEGSA